MGVFGCFRVLLPSKWLRNKIEPVPQQNETKNHSKHPWESLISTSYSVVSWDAESSYKPTVVTKPGGVSFGVSLKDGNIDIFSIPHLPPKRLPPINREDIASLKKPKRSRRKGKAKKSKLSVEEKLARAKARREASESERKEKTLKKLKMVVPQ